MRWRWPVSATLDEALPLMVHVVDHEASSASDANMQILERLAWLGMMYAQAAMPAEADATARRIDEIAAQVESVSMPIRLRNELTKAYAAAYGAIASACGNSRRRCANYPGFPKRRAWNRWPSTLSTRVGKINESRAREVALQLAEGVEASRLPGYRRSCVLVDCRLGAARSERQGERTARARSSRLEEYRKAGLETSVQLTEFVYARGAVVVLTGDTTVRDDLQTLVSSWQKVHPNSLRHGEALYWLSRVQAAGRSGGSCCADASTGRRRC